MSESWGGSSGEGEGDSGFLTAESDSRSVRFSSSKDIQKVIYQDRLPKGEIAAKILKKDHHLGTLPSWQILDKSHIDIKF